MTFPLPLPGPLGGPPEAPPCTLSVFYDAQHFLDLFDRLLPPSYLQPLKSPGPGYEVLQAYAQAMQRVSLAVARTDCGAHILSSFGAAFSQVVVIFARPVDNDPGETLVIKAGTVVTTSNGGRDFVTQKDITFAPGDLGPHSVLAVGALPQFEFDVPGEVLTAAGIILPGDIDLVKTLLLNVGYPTLGMPNFEVNNPDRAAGGMPPMLDGLGNDRGLPRNPGESDAAYKTRIRALPDTVSPDAIVRNVLDYLGNYCGGSLEFQFIETFQATYQTAFDCPSPNFGTPTYQAAPPGALDQNLFTYDDPRPPYPPFRNRWLSEEDYRAAFIVVVPNVDAISDVGMAYDDTAIVPADFVTECGYRSVSAYDIPPGFTADSPGGYDGFDLGKQAMYKGLYDLLQRIKAAGMLAAVELQGE